MEKSTCGKKPQRVREGASRMLNPTQKIPPELPTEQVNLVREAGVVPRYQSTVVLAADRAGLQLWVKQGGTARVIVEQHALVPDGMGAFFVVFEK